MESLSLCGSPACLQFGSNMNLRAPSHEPTVLECAQVVADSTIGRLIASCERGKG